MKTYYKDFYGCTASINTVSNDKHVLRVCTASGNLIKKGSYKSFAGARIAMGKLSDCWGKAEQGR